jgi:nondiscriminating aspartyl-tRNA synthetase
MKIKSRRNRKMIKITGNLEKVRVEADQLSNHIGNTVQIHGSIYKIRKMSDFAFVLLRAKREIVQCVYSKEMSKFPLEELEEGIVDGIREFLKKEKFTEIRTPKIVYAGAEGGANIFHLDYFGRDAYLAQSPQFYKQMMVGVYERVFEIAPVYRTEKHDTSRHLNEYISVDFEMGYIDSFEEIMQTETMMLRHIVQYLEQNYEPEINLLKIKLPVINEIPVVKFIEAKELIAKEYHRKINDYDDFEPEEEKLLCRWIRKETGSDFVFITYYPSKKRPFYAMENKENREETLSFDLLFRGLEITTGGQRIHSYQEQVEKMKRREMDIEQFGSCLMIHKYGMPPHGGLGLGLERFTSRLLEQENVRFSTLFPRDINRLIP